MPNITCDTTIDDLIANPSSTAFTKPVILYFIKDKFFNKKQEVSISEWMALKGKDAPFDKRLALMKKICELPESESNLVKADVKEGLAGFRYNDKEFKEFFKQERGTTQLQMEEMAGYINTLCNCELGRAALSYVRKPSHEAAASAAGAGFKEASANSFGGPPPYPQSHAAVGASAASSAPKEGDLNLEEIMNSLTSEESNDFFQSLLRPSSPPSAQGEGKGKGFF